MRERAARGPGSPGAVRFPGPPRIEGAPQFSSGGGELEALQGALQAAQSGSREEIAGEECRGARRESGEQGKKPQEPRDGAARASRSRREDRADPRAGAGRRPKKAGRSRGGAGRSPRWGLGAPGSHRAILAGLQGTGTEDRQRREQPAIPSGTAEPGGRGQVRAPGGTKKGRACPPPRASPQRCLRRCGRKRVAAPLTGRGVVVRGALPAGSCSSRCPGRIIAGPSLGRVPGSPLSAASGRSEEGPSGWVQRAEGPGRVLRRRQGEAAGTGRPLGAGGHAPALGSTPDDPGPAESPRLEAQGCGWVCRGPCRGRPPASLKGPAAQGTSLCRVTEEVDAQVSVCGACLGCSEPSSQRCWVSLGLHDLGECSGPRCLLVSAQASAGLSVVSVHGCALKGETVELRQVRSPPRLHPLLIPGADSEAAHVFGFGPQHNRYQK